MLLCNKWLPLLLLLGAAHCQWEGPQRVLDSAVADEAFPGCVGVVCSRGGPIFQTALGHYGYGREPLPHSANEAVRLSTRY